MWLPLPTPAHNITTMHPSPNPAQRRLQHTPAVYAACTVVHVSAGDVETHCRFQCLDPLAVSLSSPAHTAAWTGFHADLSVSTGYRQCPCTNRQPQGAPVRVQRTQPYVSRRATLQCSTLSWLCLPGGRGVMYMCSVSVSACICVSAPRRALPYCT
jgi:hypothetical protein